MVINELQLTMKLSRCHKVSAVIYKNKYWKTEINLKMLSLMSLQVSNKQTNKLSQRDRETVSLSCVYMKEWEKKGGRKDRKEQDRGEEKE